MTPIKCPPPKIVAVKRSLKKTSKSNIMDDDDVKVKDDFINDDDSLSSFDSRDLIEFEREELLIDLSETPVVEKEISEDTIKSKNARNSHTLLSLLDLLEIGNVMRTTEKELLGSCAEDDVSDRNPVVSKTSSSSSSRNIPSERPGACAASSGKTDKLSTVFPPLSIQPENPSIAKSFCRHSEDLKSEAKETLKVSERVDNQKSRVSDGIEEKVIDSTLQKLNRTQSEKSKENLVSSSRISFSKSDCSIETCSCKTNKKSLLNDEDSDDSLNKEKENSVFCQSNHHQQLQNHNDVTTPKSQLKVQVTKVEKSDTNNNHESVSNQNSLDDSLSLSRVYRHEGGTKQLASTESLKFLSPHTSQRKLPPKFYSSTSSLNQDSFEASTRLKRLEERFKGFSYTKKLLRSSKVFSKSEEILSSYGKAREFKFPEPLNSSFDHPLSSTTLSENCLRQLTALEEEDKGEESHKDYQDRKTSSSDDISGE